ncbi:uncharacterized protein BKA55DRAFT_556336 [Fusarium redolens]|uniref:Uncharacterized protein n=1 Tax=Fusarium redolens TaxID=48865 RepID=A0A9P9KSA6_FUSRE|nr:uncharacterized protein BKA55DRAFT_556336 [Fusarium redolens]KAH7267660.1 hypothetical protein BKA55DRAFT_556336 [Fusarium redolens]
MVWKFMPSHPLSQMPFHRLSHATPLNPFQNQHKKLPPHKTISTNSDVGPQLWVSLDRQSMPHQWSGQMEDQGSEHHSMQPRQRASE